VCVQPDPGAQASAVQSLPSSQFGPPVPVHVPAWQVSVTVQALPSSHAAPLVLLGFEQLPLAGLHVPALWHWSEGVHTTGFEPVHVPVWQVSVCVQAFVSLQLVPLGRGESPHSPVPVLHTPTLH
jgi:hypothetical protein